MHNYFQNEILVHEKIIGTSRLLSSVWTWKIQQPTACLACPMNSARLAYLLSYNTIHSTSRIGSELHFVSEGKA
jgi:hypothetical protein